MKIGLGSVGIVVVCVLWMILETYVAYRGGWLFTSQVTARWSKPGISFSTHGGMYGDVLLPLLFAWIIAKYGDSWDVWQVVAMIGVGVLFTTGNHLLLVFTQATPDPLGWKGEKWSTLIALHFVYMSVAVAFIGLFFFSPGVSVAAAIAVSVILGVHMAFGMHVPLGMLVRFARLGQHPDFLSNTALPWMQLGIWFLLAGFAWRAAGWQAGLSVAGIGSGLVSLLFLFIRLGPPPLK